MNAKLLPSASYDHLIRVPFLTVVITLVFVCRSSAQQDHVDGRLIQFNDNGAWSWFEDERSMVDTTTGQVLVSSVADSSGARGRSGDVDVASFSLSSGRVSQFTLATIDADDHNSAGLLKMNDGRYLAAYANHGTDNLTRSRVSTNAGDISSWNSEVQRNNGARATYNNIYQLSGENNRIYNFTRTVNWDPNVLYSEDNGQSWSYGAKLLNAGGGSTRPYVKYASNNVDSIHFINTENHPRNFNNSVYHAYIKGGEVFDSFGNKLDDLDANGMASNAGTQIFQGNSSNVAWVSDIHLDNSGNPFVAFSVQKPGNGTDHRYHYARFDGNSWQQNEIAFAGSRLYAGEDDYTGNIALNPNNPNEVYISTNSDPTTGAALVSAANGRRQWEIYKGTSTDNGQSFSWTAVTQNSTVDNLRPIIPDWDANNKAVLWMRGDYTTYTNYDLAVVGIVEQAGETSDSIRYFDANSTNTQRTDGATWNPTTGSGQGASDNRWHIRTGYGNGGSVLASDENSSENVAALTTTVENVDGEGVFDVYAYFWSNKNEDWEFTAGLDSNDLKYFRKQGGQHADASLFFDPVIVSSGDGNELMYQAYLGRVFLTDGELLSVFVDDGFNQNGLRRTWYDGIGLSRVNFTAVPEPTAVSVLMGMMLVCGLRRRRNV